MTSFLPAVDTHAHVFDRSCRLVEGRRYTPEYEATIEAYIAMLDGAGVRYGVLVQPSFLGTDNAYLLAGLRRCPQRLRGIVVPDSDVPDDALEEMARLGVRGIRYNLVGRDPGLVGEPGFRALTRRVSALGWIVQVQAPGSALPRVLDVLTEDAATIIVDHFGKPETENPAEDPGFRRLMAFASGGPVWVKLSAQYRLGAVNPAPYAAAFLAHFGPDRLLWGSDWPWTENETVTSYGECVGQIGQWLGDDPEIQASFNRASLDLYGFGA
jgi:predicted TIM-barrel fold metal-dependent hydrolase